VEQMRKDISFSDRKLSTDEFSRKYWRDGETPYQYHTGQIEDGRDEREQFVFNNIRAIWERMKDSNRNSAREKFEMWQRIANTERNLSRITFGVAVMAALQIIRMLRDKRS
jgi:hypothetical protein